MKLFLDDVRNPPDDTWDVVRKYKTALDYWRLYPIEEISFDHDLGEENTGYDFAKFIEFACNDGHPCPKWQIHSANPVGRKNIEMAMKNAEKLAARMAK